MSWKSEVAQIILEINQEEFTSKDIWKYLDRLIEKYPNASTPTVTVLCTLTQLRDMEAIEFVSRGKYRLTSDGRDILKGIGTQINWHELISRNWDKHYPRYIETDTWRAKRITVLERDGYLCVCGANASVVHHKRYDNIGKEPLSDLVSLCKDCHTDIHAIIKKRRGW